MRTTTLHVLRPAGRVLLPAWQTWQDLAIVSDISLNHRALSINGTDEDMTGRGFSNGSNRAFVNELLYMTFCLHH